MSALGLSRELGLRYATAWLLHYKIQWAMADRNAKYQLAGLVELDDAYFGGISHERANAVEALTKIPWS